MYVSLQYCVSNSVKSTLLIKELQLADKEFVLPFLGGSCSNFLHLYLTKMPFIENRSALESHIIRRASVEMKST